MVSFENFVKSMPPSLSELKVTPSFCFPNMIPDDPTASTMYIQENFFDLDLEIGGTVCELLLHRDNKQDKNYVI